MGQLQDIITEYTLMRRQGMEAKVVLYNLRNRIETLSRTERDDLASLLRAHEANLKSPPISPVSIDDTKPRSIDDTKPRNNVIRPIAPPIPQTDTAESRRLTTTEVEAAVVWVTCPNCGKANQKHEVFCYSCGAMLETARGTFETRHFEDANATLDSEHFGLESVLVLRVRGSADALEIRPQKSEQDVILGRGTTGSAMMPDVDLTSKGAADLGVSRLHLSLRYDGKHHSILASDLGSANGSFINGQRMLAKEVRVLRHGDELRLGRMVLMVSFRHPGNEK